MLQQPKLMMFRVTTRVTKTAVLSVIMGEVERAVLVELMVAQMVITMVMGGTNGVWEAASQLLTSSCETPLALPMSFGLGQACAAITIKATAAPSPASVPEKRKMKRLPLR